MIPGEYHVKPGQIALNTGRATCRVVVENHGDRPIHGGRPSRPDPRAGDGGRPGNDPGYPGRSHLPGRLEAGHRSQPDYLR